MTAGRVPGWLAAGAAGTAVAAAGGWRGAVSWDEPIYVSIGHDYLDWWGGSFGDLDEARRVFFEYRLHPPVASYLGAAGERIFGGLIGDVPAARLATFLCFGAMVAACWLITNRVWGRRAAHLAALACLATPRLLGLGELANSDLAVTAGWTVTVAVALAALRQPRLAPLVALAAGLTLASKLSALTFLPLLAVPLLFAAHRSAALRIAAWTAVGAPLLLLASWPWLWPDPVGQLRESIDYLQHHLPLGTVVFGHLYQQPYAPRWYPPLALLVTTPLLVLWAAAIGWGRAVCERSVDVWLIVLCAVIPMLPFVVLDVPRINGVRLFAPVLPFWAVLAGAGADWALTRAAPSRRRLYASAGGVVLAVQVVAAHPFPLAWYGELAGGPRGGEEVTGMEADFWGQSYRAIFPWMNEELPPGTVVAPFFGSGHILRRSQEAGLLRDDLVICDTFDADDALPNLFTQAPLEPRIDVLVLPAIEGMLDDRLQRVRKLARPLHSARWRGVEMAWAYAAEDAGPLLERPSAAAPCRTTGDGTSDATASSTTTGSAGAR